MLVEGLLNGMELAVGGKALDRGHVVAFRLDGEERARLDRLAVEQHRAGAARGRVAADVRACQSELISQEVDEELAGRALGLLPLPVQRYRDPRHRPSCGP